MPLPKGEYLPNASPADLLILDLALTDNGKMKLLPAAAYADFPRGLLRVWMQYRGRYQLPTLELIQWLRNRIAGRKCVEVGAGLGDVGRHVGGVTLTDSYFQSSPEMRVLYAANGCATTTPPPDVMKRDAINAVKKYRPPVTLACWVTQLWREGDTSASIGSCFGGVDEVELLKHTGEYIFVGNAGTHGDKRILALPHEEFAPEWIVSRAADQGRNRIWVWKGELS